MFKLNLIIDSNWMLYKNVYSLQAIGTLFGDLSKALEVSFSSYIGKYPYNKIYVISDSREKSWRKNIYSDYKGTREKSEDIDWEFVFNTYQEFKNTFFNSSKFIQLESNSIEGDDWIASVVRKTNSLNESNIILASDGDLHQLLDFKLNPLWFNIQCRETFMKEKTFFPEGYKVLIAKMREEVSDIFTESKYEQFLNLYNTWIERNEIEEVNPFDEMFVKIISGDKGDNIKSVYEATGKTGKIAGIGADGAKNILNIYKSYYNDEIELTDSAFIERVIPIIETYKKKVFNDIDVQTITNKIVLNRKLVLLKENYLPANIKNTINEKINLIK